MKIHEYQAQALFAEYGIPVPAGQMAETAEAATAAACELGADNVTLVKAQIHAGGRGKAGGVKLCRSVEEVNEAAKLLIGCRLITKQSGAEGKLVRKVLVTKGVNIDREYYLSITMDRQNCCPVLIASAAGGMDIEEVAATRPEQIIRHPINPVVGLTDYSCFYIAAQLGLNWELIKEFTSLTMALYRLFIEKDCSLVEINPLVKTKEKHLIAVDAKIDIDSNALFRHPELAQLRDLNEEDPKEVEASKYDLNYVPLNGNIGCMVNGAGLAMATMDIIEAYGGHPANFLDVGGSATAEKVAGAFRILLSDPNVKAILVNIFGGIMKCDIIAKGIVEAAKQTNLEVPLIVRLAGTNAAQGAEILAQSGLDIVTARNLTDAAQKSVAALNRQEGS